MTFLERVNRLQTTVAADAAAREVLVEQLTPQINAVCAKLAGLPLDAGLRHQRLRGGHERQHPGAQALAREQGPDAGAHWPFGCPNWRT
jgi:hypothetical protein